MDWRQSNFKRIDCNITGDSGVPLGVPKPPKQRRPRCPQCNYDLSGVTPPFVGNPSPEHTVTCSECGSLVTLLAALNVGEPDPSPRLTFTLLVIASFAWFIMCAGCLAFLFAGFRS